MMHIGHAHEAGGLGSRRGKVAGLSLPSGDVAGYAIVPVAGLGGGKTDHQLLAAIPEGRSQERTLVRRAELGSQLHAEVGVGMSRGIRATEIEDDIASGIGRGVLARLLCRQ